MLLMFFLEIGKVCGIVEKFFVYQGYCGKGVVRVFLVVVEVDVL